MSRSVVCYEIPAFGIAVARLRDPVLRDRPVAIAAVQHPRACLHELSAEALEADLTIGMPIEQARRLCPGLRVIPHDPLQVRLAEQELRDVIAQFAPVWEPVRPGHLFLDLTGTGRLFGPPADTAVRIQRQISRRSGLQGMLGVASNKLVSHAAATLVRPSQLCDVLPGAEPAFMAPLPVSALPRLSRSKTGELAWPMILRRLEDLNLSTLGEVAAVPVEQLARVCGRAAYLLHDQAQGIDRSPVFPPQRHPRLQLTTMLAADEVDDDRLLGVLAGLTEQLCHRLREQRRMCGRLTLRLTYSDRQEGGGVCRLRRPTYWEVDMSEPLTALFFRVFRRRIRLRGLTLTAERLVPAAEQLSLFEPPRLTDAPLAPSRPRLQRLALALDTLRNRFGTKAIAFGRNRCT